METWTRDLRNGKIVGTLKQVFCESKCTSLKVKVEMNDVFLEWYFEEKKIRNGRMKNMAGSKEFLFNLKEFLFSLNEFPSSLKEFFTNRKTKVRGETGSMERKNHENDGKTRRGGKGESGFTI